MKQTLILLCATLLLASCTGNSTQKQDKQTVTNTVNTVAYIDQETLRTTLYDYTDAQPTYKGKKPAVIDIYTTWCPPCKIMAPILEELAQEFGDQVDFYKFDAEQETTATGMLRIQGYPTFLFLTPGKPAHIQLGALSKEAFIQLLRTHLLQNE